LYELEAVKQKSECRAAAPGAAASPQTSAQAPWTSVVVDDDRSLWALPGPDRVRTL